MTNFAGGAVDQQTRYELQAITRTVGRLSEKLRALATALGKVNDKTQRVITTTDSLAIGLHDVTVTWPRPWPDTGYGVWVSLQLGDAALGSVHAILKPGTKTTTGCVIRIRCLVLVGTVGVDVLGVRT